MPLVLAIFMGGMVYFILIILLKQYFLFFTKFLNNIFVQRAKLIFNKKISIGFALLLIGLMYWFDFGLIAVIYGGLLVILAWYWPALYWRRADVLYTRQIERNLPQIIDLICLEISAGRNLSMAIAGSAGEATGPWRTALQKIVDRQNLGISLSDALSMAAKELKSPDFSHFVAAIKQAEKLGAELENTLLTQASILRSRRRYQIEEKARQASVKISLPLVLCVFPALLIIYLMPVIIHLILTL